MLLIVFFVLLFVLPFVHELLHYVMAYSLDLNPFFFVTWGAIGVGHDISPFDAIVTYFPDAVMFTFATIFLVFGGRYRLFSIPFAAVGVWGMVAHLVHL